MTLDKKYDDAPEVASSGHASTSPRRPPTSSRRTYVFSPGDREYYLGRIARNMGSSYWVGFIGFVVVLFGLCIWLIGQDLSSADALIGKGIGVVGRIRGSSIEGSDARHRIFDTRTISVFNDYGECRPCPMSHILCPMSYVLCSV